MEYEIIGISHSQPENVLWNPRTDGRYPMRIGRIIDLDRSRIVEDESAILAYVRDADGSPYDGYLHTSIVKNIQGTGDTIFIETMNSIYALRKV